MSFVDLFATLSSTRRVQPDSSTLKSSQTSAALLTHELYTDQHLHVCPSIRSSLR